MQGLTDLIALWKHSGLFKLLIRNQLKAIQEDSIVEDIKLKHLNESTKAIQNWFDTKEKRIKELPCMKLQLNAFRTKHQKKNILNQFETPFFLSAFSLLSSQSAMSCYWAQWTTFSE